MIGSAITAVGRAREWLTLLLVGAAAAWMYVHWQEERAGRQQLAAWADATCAAAGAPFAASAAQVVDSAGKPRTITYAAGQRCRAAVSTAVAFRAETERAAARALADAMRERDARDAADAQLAARAAEATLAATERMEKADAEAERLNRVGGNWFAALNDLAGLRPANR